MVIAGQIGTVVTWYILGAFEAALLATAMMIPMEAGRFGSIINQAILPRFSRQQVSLYRLYRYIGACTVLLAIAWGVYALIVPTLFDWFFPSYTQAVPLTIAAMISIIAIPKSVLRALVSAQKMKSVITRLTLVVPLGSIMLTVVLVPWWGLWGAVSAFVFGQFLEYVLLIMLLIRFWNKHELISEKTSKAPC